MQEIEVESGDWKQLNYAMWKGIKAYKVWELSIGRYQNWLGANNRTKRNIWYISLSIADKTGDTSKILPGVRNSHPAVFFKKYVL